LKSLKKGKRKKNDHDSTAKRSFKKIIRNTKRRKKNKEGNFSPKKKWRKRTHKFSEEYKNPIGKYLWTLLRVKKKKKKKGTTYNF